MKKIFFLPVMVALKQIYFNTDEILKIYRLGLVKPNVCRHYTRSYGY